jgi:hypothetical protein
MSATIVLTMDAEAYATGVGTATTGHGYAVPADVAKTWAGEEARVIGVLLRDTQRIEAYSSTQRCFTEQQRIDRAGQGLHLLRLRPATRLVPNPSCARVP